MQVIAMAGLAQCGKSTLAGWIAEEAYKSGLTPKMMSFAGALKRAAETIGADKASNPALYRKFCQDVGNACRTSEYVPGVTGEDYWVRLTNKTLLTLQLSDSESLRRDSAHYRELIVIFDDVRFMNELAMLRDWDATTIFVDRRNELPDPTAEFRKHISEKMATDLTTDRETLRECFKYSVDSSGSMDEYRRRVGIFLPVWCGTATLGIPDAVETDDPHTEIQ